MEVLSIRTLEALLLPPGGLVILLLLGLMLIRTALGRLLVLLATLLLYGLSTAVGSAWLAAQVETVPPLTIEPGVAAKAQAIVVFLAGMDPDAPELSGEDGLDVNSLRRLAHAALLQRELGLPIILSGGLPRPPDHPAMAVIAAKALSRYFGLAPLAIEDRSRTTWENAQFVAPILRQHGMHSVILVTQAAHMPRALFAMQHTGIPVVPAPTGYVSRPDQHYLAGTEFSDWIPHAGYLKKSYLALHELLGMQWYRWRLESGNDPGYSDLTPEQEAAPSDSPDNPGE